MNDYLDTVVQGDCLDVLRELPDCSVELCATDPPFGIAFMSKTWDSDIPARAIWAEVLRVLKPGASCFVCAGSRQDTILGLLTDLREVGFDIQHAALSWVYWNGFPKSSCVSKQCDKAAFLAWLREVPPGETETRQALMGWDAADVRKAASAAVNGCYSETLDCTGKQVGKPPKAGDRDDLLRYGGDNERPWATGGRGTGTLLLAALQARFGDAPGVRQKVGEYVHPSIGPEWVKYASCRKEYESETFGRDTSGRTITSPSTPEAVQWDGWRSGSVALKPASEQILWVTKPAEPGPARANVLKWGVGAVHISACSIPCTMDNSADRAATIGDGAAHTTDKSTDGIGHEHSACLFHRTLGMALCEAVRDGRAVFHDMTNGLPCPPPQGSPSCCPSSYRCDDVRIPLATALSQACQRRRADAQEYSHLSSRSDDSEPSHSGSPGELCSHRATDDYGSNSEDRPGSSAYHDAARHVASEWRRLSLANSRTSLIDGCCPYEGLLDTLRRLSPLSACQSEEGPCDYSLLADALVNVFNVVYHTHPANANKQAPGARYPSNLLVTARALGDDSKYGDLEAWAREHGISDEWLDAALSAGVLRVPKPSRSEKNAGCEGLEEREPPGSKRSNPAPGRELPLGRPRSNHHPTTKPVTLMAFLCTLACPRVGVVLDPFLGSGTTAVAAVQSGMHYIGIEREPEYVTIAEARIAAALRNKQPTLALEAAE